MLYCPPRVPRKLQPYRNSPTPSEAGLGLPVLGIVSGSRRDALVFQPDVVPPWECPLAPPASSWPPCFSPRRLSLCLVMWVQAEQDRDPRTGHDRIQPQQAGDAIPTHITRPLQASPPGQGCGDPLAMLPPLSPLGSRSREHPQPLRSRMSPGLSIPQPCTHQGEHGH